MKPLPSLLVFVGIAGSVVAADVPSSSSTAIAAPRIIMFHGGELGSERRYMTDWWENLDLMQSISETWERDSAAVSDARVVEVTLFWYGPAWERHARDTLLLKTLSPSQGASLRLALGLDHQALRIRYPYHWRRIDSTGVAILRRHNVPVSSP